MTSWEGEVEMDPSVAASCRGEAQEGTSIGLLGTAATL